MNQKNPLQIIMLGPILTQQGGIANNQRLFLEYAPPEAQIYHIVTHDEGSILHRIIVFGKAVVKLVWMLLQRDIDLVHIRMSQGGSAFRQAITTFLVWVFGKPIILHAHGGEFHLFYSNLPQWVQQVLSWVFCKCRHLIVLSETWKNFYTKDLGLTSEQVVVLYNPVKLPSQVPQRSGSQKINILFLGRIGPRKGAFDLIKAFATLPHEHKERTTLIVAGDGEVEEARSLVKSLNLTEQITIPGWVGQEERNALLAKVDVFVLPSYNEGLSLAMLEAMGWGLPIIVTPVGGVSEVVTQGESGLLVNPGDIEQLSEAMKSLIENESLRLSLGAKARTRVVPFDINNYWVSVLEVYRSSLESEPRNSVSTT